MKTIPLTAADLIKQLDEDYPPRPPALNDPEREVWAKAGERRLVETLLLRLKKTHANQSLLKQES